jgi:putative acetyltransferase
MDIRPEAQADFAAIGELVSASMRPQEAVLVELIRASDRYLPELALVAVERRGAVVGHVMLSQVDLVGPEMTRQVLCLAPLAVTPPQQRRGIGSALVRRALSDAEARSEPLVMVLGHAAYYPRFGFEPARPLGIDPPQPRIRDEVWMVRRLSAYSPELRGRIEYPSAFAAAGSAAG